MQAEALSTELGNRSIGSFKLDGSIHPSKHSTASSDSLSSLTWTLLFMIIYPGTLWTATSASWIASSGFLLWLPFLALRRLSRGTFGLSGGMNRCHEIIQRAPTMLQAIRYTSGGDNLEEHRQAHHRSPLSRPYYLQPWASYEQCWTALAQRLCHLATAE